MKCKLPSDHGFFNIPAMFQCLDVEAQCRGNCVNVFTIKFLEDCRFASVIKTSVFVSRMSMCLFSLQEKFVLYYVCHAKSCTNSRS